MNKAILYPEIQEFIQKNIHADINSIALSKSPFSKVSSRELARQIDGKKRTQTKLPLWYNTSLIYYPEKLALEQCSSEETARYKSLLVTGETFIDLTGGFGVDSCFMSRSMKKATHCEVNQDLSEISAYNSKVLGFDIEHINADGIQYLRESDKNFDTVYIDPSRRVSTRRVFLLQDCEPDVVKEMDVLSKHSKRVIIKTAPLLDIQSTIKELGSVSEVHVLSVKNECREVVYVINKGTTETDPAITCAVLNKSEVMTFTFRASEEKAFNLNEYSQPLAYLYEPDVALLKSGCFKLITKEYNVGKLHQHTHLYTSDLIRDGFPGRRFRVLDHWDYGNFIKQHNFKKANIISRNFPQDPDKIRKKLKIADGGDDYLLFCTGPKSELLVIHCARIDQ